MQKIHTFKNDVINFIAIFNSEVKEFVEDYKELVVCPNYKIKIENDNISILFIKLLIFIRITHYYIIKHYKKYIGKITNVLLNILSQDIEILKTNEIISMRKYLQKLFSDSKMNSKDFTFGRKNTGNNHLHLLGEFKNNEKKWVSLKFNRLESPYSNFAIMIVSENTVIRTFKFGNKH